MQGWCHATRSAHAQVPCGAHMRLVRAPVMTCQPTWRLFGSVNDVSVRQFNRAFEMASTTSCRTPLIDSTALPTCAHSQWQRWHGAEARIAMVDYVVECKPDAVRDIRTDRLPCQARQVDV